MTALGPGEMRARRRPFVVLAIAALRLTLGFCLALPLASLIGDSGLGQTPRGDRALFEGGGYLLIELLRVKGADLAAVTRGLVPLALLGLLVTAASNAALLVALNLAGRLQLRAWLARASGYVPALVVLGVGTALTQLAFAILGGVAAAAIPEPLARPLAGSAGQVACWLVAALLAGAAGGFSDVVKAALVRNDAGLAAAVRHALDCLKRRPLGTLLGHLPYGLALVAAIALAAELTSLLDVSRPAAWRLAAVFTLHQAVVVGSVALRAAWYARALRLTASV